MSIDPSDKQTIAHFNVFCFSFLLMNIIPPTVILEIFDDVQRCHKDRKTNFEQMANVVTSGKIERVQWKVPPRIMCEFIFLFTYPNCYLSIVCVLQK